MNLNNLKMCIRNLNAVKELPIKQMAYVLATIRHETDGTFLPIREYNRGKGKHYGTVYYGRGYVQITWKNNYLRMGNIIGVDLVNHPDKALIPENAAKIAIIGMTRGIFTGKKLSDFITDEKCDYFNARKIINGTNKAGLIQGYAREFESYLSAKAKADN